MREIEFRGKRKDNGEWVYGGYHKHIKRQISPIGDSLQDDDIAHLIIQSGFADWNMPKPLQAIEVIPETVGQFTGLHDKNGKEIYEGDICIVSLSYFKIKNEKATVIFHNGAFQFQYGCEKFFSKPHDAWDEVDVIGNVHTNPELLKEVSHEA
jgi:uncharacterized phage protein (TIGR01671 family)